MEDILVISKWQQEHEAMLRDFPPPLISHVQSMYNVLKLNSLVCVVIRNVGLPWQRPYAEEISLHHDEEWDREGRSEEKVEVAANPAEQGGQEHVHYFTL